MTTSAIQAGAVFLEEVDLMAGVIDDGVDVGSCVVEVLHNGGLFPLQAVS